jgi:hypothetical protein
MFKWAGGLRIRYLLAILVALVTIDGITSQFLIKSASVREGNPVLEPVAGGPVFIPLKLFGALLCAFLLWDIYKARPRLALTATYCFVGIYSAIVFWNIASFAVFKG